MLHRIGVLLGRVEWGVPCPLVLVGLLMVGSEWGVQATCVQVEGSPCKCRTSDGWRLDLTRLQNLPFTAENGDYIYVYNPCQPLAMTDLSCNNVSICQKTIKQPVTLQNAGVLSTVKFEGDPHDDSLVLAYASALVSPETPVADIRYSRVNIKCGSSPQFTAHGELAEKKHYSFTLSTSLACYPSGLSTGSILLIVFFVLLILYFVIGVLILRFGRGARGVEQIPNYLFWSDLPSLVKDGCVYLINGCGTKQRIRYDQI